MKQYPKSSPAALLVAAALAGCAAPPYQPETTTTARLRLVAQGAGNSYFYLQAPGMNCKSTPGVTGSTPTGQYLLALAGVVAPGPKFGSPIRVGMPGADAHPDWTSAELNFDAGRERTLRVNNVSGSTSVLGGSTPVYDLARCEALLTMTLAAARDYELVFSSAGTPRCRAQLFVLETDAGGRLQRTPMPLEQGPPDCKAAPK